MDLYALLGVRRSASAGDIERAYRRMARRYHPGVNPGDRVAGEMYGRIQQAYQVLGDSGSRREYDQGATRPAVTATAVSFEGFDFSSVAEGSVAATFSELFAGVFRDAALRATAPTGDVPVEATLSLSFADAVRGGQFPLSVARQGRCSRCAGDGRVACPPVRCPACEGHGSTRWARGHMVFTRSCEACRGDGRLTARPCPTCAGSGLRTQSDVVTVHVPPGIEDGARIAVPGRGHAPAGGGPVGYLYVLVSVADHPFLRREGRDLHLVLPLAVHEAVLGGRVDVPTLGKSVRLRIPPGTPSGRRFKIRGRGVPSVHGEDAPAGDLIVDVQIVLPAVRDDRSRELLREFGERNAQDVRRHLFGESEG
jgi:molecular chaperone DnaJ